MNFTREPLIETVITPREGYKLVVRSSQGEGQEEFFVDAVEIVTFGTAVFFRSLEKPKCFLVPVTDYEILEVRESRMVLKTPSAEKGIKIAGGRDTLLKPLKEEVPSSLEMEAAAIVEQRTDKRRERRHHKKKRLKNSGEEESEVQAVSFMPESSKEKRGEKPSLIPPPSMLISETISRYKNLPHAGEGRAEEAAPTHAQEPEEYPTEDEEVPF